MIADRLQRQRFELKYQLAPRHVPGVREFVRCHLEPDPFSAVQPDVMKILTENAESLTVFFQADELTYMDGTSESGLQL